MRPTADRPADRRPVARQAARRSGIRLSAAAGAALVAVTTAACAPMPSAPRYETVTAGADGESFGASMSDDGNLVVFTSEATNLVPGDLDGRADVFLHDRRTRTTTNLTAGLDADALDPVISGDGTTVAFSSDADGTSDVYRLTLAGGALTNLTPAGDDFSGYPAISDDGARIVFQSFASNLGAAPDADGGAPDIFVVDGAVTTAVTTSPGDFFQPAVSGDGAAVAFQAYGVAGGTDTAPVVVVGGVVVSPVGVYSGEVSLPDAATTPAYRTFTSPNGVIRVGATVVSDPAVPATDPAVLDDGSRAAWTEGDRILLGTEVVADGNGLSAEAAPSGTGNVVAFTSYATDLGEAGANGAVGDILVRI